MLVLIENHLCLRNDLFLRLRSIGGLIDLVLSFIEKIGHENFMDDERNYFCFLFFFNCRRLNDDQSIFNNSQREE